MCKCKQLIKMDCKHEQLEYCEICDNITCAKCGRQWGEKETVTIPYPIYLYWPPYNPYSRWILCDSICGTTTGNVSNATTTI